MTIVATDGFTLACDSHIFGGADGYDIAGRRARKVIFGLGSSPSNSVIHALVGTSHILKPLAAWYAKGADPENMDSHLASLSWCLWTLHYPWVPHAPKPDLENDKILRATLTVHSNDNRYGYTARLPAAAGAPMNFALGAMDFGISPIEAARNTGKRSSLCGPPFVEIDIRKSMLAGCLLSPDGEMAYREPLFDKEENATTSSL